jgi:hypothetical protein
VDLQAVLLVLSRQRLQPQATERINRGSIEEDVAAGSLEDRLRKRPVLENLEHDRCGPVAPVSATAVPFVTFAPVVGGRGFAVDGFALSAVFGGVFGGAFVGTAITFGLGGVAGGMCSDRFGGGATCSTGRAPAETMPPDRSPGDPPRLMVMSSGLTSSRTNQSLGTTNSSSTVPRWMAMDADMMRPKPAGSILRR